LNILRIIDYWLHSAQLYLVSEAFVSGRHYRFSDLTGTVTIFHPEGNTPWFSKTPTSMQCQPVRNSNEYHFL